MRPTLRRTAALFCTALCGCTSYEARPVDLLQYERLFADRPAAVQRAGTLDLDDGISRGEGEVLALLFDPELRRRRASLVAELGIAENTGKWVDPQLGFEVGQQTKDVARPGTIDARVVFTVPLSGRLEAERAAAEAGAEQALREVLAAEWHARLQLRARWCDWSRAAGQREVQAELVGELERKLGSLAALRSRGEVDAVELGRWELLLVQQRLQASSLARECANLETELKQRMGLSPTAEVLLVPDASAPPLPAPEQRVALLEVRNVDLAVQRASYEVRERELLAAVRAQYPDIQLGPIFQMNGGIDAWLAGLWIPVPIFSGNDLQLAEATGAREEARAELLSLWEAERHALRRAELELEATMRDLELVEREWLPRLAEQGARLASRSARGALDPLHELDLQMELGTARLRVLELRAATAAAAVRVLERIGPLESAAAKPEEQK
jgi:cobalt-zinc-cadmium efflux system outer membrane protein